MFQFEKISAYGLGSTCSQVFARWVSQVSYVYISNDSYKYIHVYKQTQVLISTSCFEVHISIAVEDVPTYILQCTHICIIYIHTTGQRRIIHMRIGIYTHICMHLNIYTPATHCLYIYCRNANAEGLLAFAEKRSHVRKVGGVCLCRLKNQVTIQFHVIRAQQKMSILHMYIYIYTHTKFKIQPENAGFQNKISFSSDLF